MTDFAGTELKEDLAISVWSEGEQVYKQGRRSMVDVMGTPTEVSKFNPGIRPRDASIWGWKVPPSTTMSLAVDALPDVYRAQIEYVCQTIDSSEAPLDEDHELQAQFSSPTRIKSLFPVRSDTARVHRFLTDIVPGRVEDPTGTPFWIVIHGQLNGTKDILLHKVTISLIKSLPSITWEHRGTKKHLQCLEPSSLSLTASDAPGQKMRIRWRTRNFDGTEKLQILAAKVGSPEVPVLLRAEPFRPSEGIEDGENGMVVIDKLPDSISGAGQLKLFFRLQ